MSNENQIAYSNEQISNIRPGRNRVVFTDNEFGKTFVEIKQKTITNDSLEISRHNYELKFKRNPSLSNKSVFLRKLSNQIKKQRSQK